jgi:branched-chain amino acid transport system substrate-binding protein
MLFRQLLCIAGFACLFFVPSAGATDNAILIGQAIDLSAANAEFSRDYTQGARTYFTQINADGGINGHRIVYRPQDSGGSPARAVSIAQAYVRDGASALFGFDGDDAVAAIAHDPHIQAAGVPLFAPIAGGTTLERADVYYLRADIGQEIRRIVAHLAPLGIHTFGFAVAAGQVSTSVLDVEAHKQNVQVVANIRFDPRGDGATRAAANVAARHPQAVIVIADSLAAAQFFQSYRHLDPGTFLCAPSLVNVRTLTSIMGDDARGLIISQVVPDPMSGSEMAREHRRLMEKYTDEPASQATLEGYMAAKMLVLALRRSRAPGASSLAQTLQAGGRYDLGGFALNITKNGRASSFVELTITSRDGRLLR